MKLGAFEVWEDVLDESLDLQVAPEIGDIVKGYAPKIYTDAIEFFRRTYFTDSIIDILNKLLDTLEGKEKNNIFLIYSLFGGGKTHTLLTIYHAFNNPNALTDIDVLRGHSLEKQEQIRKIADNIKSLAGVKIVPIYGKGMIGRPSKPLDMGAYKIKTLWGYIAHSLGKYAVVENDDKNLTIPEIETLRDIFKGEKVILIVDEIVDYINNLYHSGNEEDRRYANNIASFFDRLSTALLGTGCIMVMTLPMEKIEGEFKYEGEYEKSIILTLWTAVSRVGGSELYSPLKTSGANNELVEVLKKRIFKYIDENEKIETITKIQNAYTDTDIFGKDSYISTELRKSYPFHPEYIDVLKTIIEKTGLQRTRDMLRITRIVIRELIKSYENDGFYPSIIMPYHINIHNEKIKGMLFGKNEIYGDYGIIVESDLSPEKFKDFSEPELAEIILKYIFLKTYPYDSPTPQTGFPTLHDIARGVYEPNLFDAKNWIPSSIKDIVDEIRSSVRFIYLNEKDNVFWFWRIANVIQMVESKARELKDMEYGNVWKELVKYANRMIREGKYLKNKKRIEEKYKSFFKDIIVTKDPQELQDSPDYMLEVLVRDDVDENTLRKIIYKYGTGSRTYKNTTVVCYLKKGCLDNLLETCATVIACDKVVNEINAKYGKFGEDVVKIQKSMVYDIKNKALENLEDQIVASFRLIAYPKDNDIEIIESSQSNAKSVVDSVYSALLGCGKIVDDCNFEYIVEIFRDIGINILKPEGYPFSEIISTIRTNTKLPMIKNTVLVEAVKNAIIDLKIGLEYEGKIYFKKIYDNIPNTDEKGNPPISIKNGYILPKEIALNKQVNQLLNNEREYITTKNGKDYLIKESYVLYPPSSDNEIPLRDFVVEINGEYKIIDEYFDMVLWGYILRKREEIEITEGEFELDIERTQIKGKPGECVDIKIKVKPLSKDTFIVKLSADIGELSESEVELNNNQVEVIWTLSIPDKKTTVKITGESHKKSKAKTITLIPELEEDIIETSSIDEKHKGFAILAILSIKDLNTLDLLPQELYGTVSGKLIIDNPKWESSFENIDLDVFKYLSGEIVDYLEGEAKIDIDLLLSEQLIIDDLLYEKLKMLNDKVIFKLKKLQE